MQYVLTQHNCFVMSGSGNQFCSSIIILENSDGEHKIFFPLFYQFTSGMKYENQDSCPGHIIVNVVDDRTCDDYSR